MGLSWAVLPSGADALASVSTAFEPLPTIISHHLWLQFIAHIFQLILGVPDQTCWFP